MENGTKNLNQTGLGTKSGTAVKIESGSNRHGGRNRDDDWRRKLTKCGGGRRPTGRGLRAGSGGGRL
ncbi:hypothetical protein EVAR_25995_1 [Eumeta japonica]|uniref:Uncharacterized protein n=1 Tax=Eumeta variegata TaxID=151549 RepID=A0A4C1V3I0_EUMVA|nr:hypothetical protein EVAR_25995_1 [Eumeta japonica]